MINKLLSTEVWFHGLFAAFIGGGASALTAAASLWGAKSSGLDVPVLNFKAFGIVFISSGIFSAASYLKQSPLPPIAVEDSDKK